MSFEFRSLLPADFADDSRVWIYQATRTFSDQEIALVEPILHSLARDWTSHGTPVKGYAALLFRQFIVVLADETATGVSGCSTDGSVRVIKDIERRFDVSLFDRLLLAFIVEDEIKLIATAQLSSAITDGTIGSETLYFNNTVQTKQELERSWIVPARNSWLGARYFAIRQPVI